MDGVPAVEPSPYIDPGKSFAYEFVVKNPPGTHIYHSHVNTATQVMMGLSGPRGGHLHVDRDFSLQVQTWKLDGQPTGQVKKGTFKLDPHSMLPNFFTINGKCIPDTKPMTALLDQEDCSGGRMCSRNRTRCTYTAMNLLSWGWTEIPPYQQFLKSTINVASGETFDVQLHTNNPGV